MTISNNIDDSYTMYFLAENIRFLKVPKTVKIPQAIVDSNKIDSYLRILLLDYYELTYDFKKLQLGRQLLNVEYEPLDFDYNDFDDNNNFEDSTYVEYSLNVEIRGDFITAMNDNCIKYVGMFDNLSADDAKVTEDRIIRQEVYERMVAFLPISIYTEVVR